MAFVGNVFDALQRSRWIEVEWRPEDIEQPKVAGSNIAIDEIAIVQMRRCQQIFIISRCYN